MAADKVLKDAYRRFLVTEEAITSAYQTALTAYNSRLSTVTITAAQFEGGSTSGQIEGSPRDIMEVCEELLRELEGDDKTSDVAHRDFSYRMIEA